MQSGSRARRFLIAFALSCGVYLLPIATVHWIDAFGLVLVQEIASDRVLAWKSADMVLALLLQVVLFASAWWVLPRGRVAAIGLTALLLVPGAIALNVAYLYAIPVYFLIESDTTPDRSAWAEQCALEGYSLDPVPEGTSRALERRGEAWVRSDDGQRYGIMRVPGCTVEPVAIPTLSIAAGLHQSLPDGSVVYVTMERGSPEQTYWLLRRGSAEPVRLRAPEGRTDAPPLVADDGAWVAWLMRTAQREVSLRIEALEGGEPIVFSHALLEDATLVPVELDMATREVVVNRNLSAFVRLRLDGTVAWGPVTPGEVSAQNDTFRWLDGQWVGWDAYVDDSRYRVTWSTKAGRGTYAAPRGRSITSGALDARGRYVSVSTTTSLNIGDIKDTVVVMRTSDSGEVFRKTLPTYTRSQVAFLGDDYFAYSDVDNARSRVHVLRVADIPASGVASPP